VDVPGVILPITANAANMETWGAELEAQLEPFKGFNLSGALGWTDAKIKNAITSAGESLKGNKPVNTAKWTFNGRAAYEHEVGSDLLAFIGGDANYRSSQYLEVSNGANDREAGYWIVNGQIGVRSSSRGWSFTGWVKNLTNNDYRTYTNDLPALGFILNIYGPPRTYGATLSFEL
jgi:iron complex outermembrane receptor protein